MTKLRTIAALAAIAFLSGCDNQSSKQAKQQDIKVAESKLDKWSWLPKSSKFDVEATQIPKGAEVSFFIPEDEPLDAKSVGWGGVDSFGNFVPRDKNSYVVKGGALVSKLGQIEKRAKWGDWDFVYADAAHMEHAGWGLSLISGEILLPRKVFLDPPTNIFVECKETQVVFHEKW
jgi:hypothetical protein